MVPIEDLESIAVSAARKAGALLEERRGKAQIKGTQYGSKLCVTTEEDGESELVIVDIIRHAFPDHGFLAEEQHKTNRDAEYLWVIDPIDGTNNWLSEDRDTYSVSIACYRKGEPLLGAVYLPARDELFLARAGSGATLNGTRIHVGKNSDLADADVTFSTMPGSEAETESLNERVLEALPHVRHFGYLKEGDVDPLFGRGSMAAEFCFLACGRIDGLIRLKQKPWDVAAGSIIAREAGAVMTDLEGNECSIHEGDYVAANPGLQPRLLEALR